METSVVSAASALRTLTIPVCGLGLSFKADAFRLIFAGIACYMWLMTTLFSKEYMAHYKSHARYYGFLFATLFAVVGLFLSDDLFTTFVFFEIMSMTSYVCVIHEETSEALYAGGVYLAVAIIGGMVTLMGLFLLNNVAGTLSVSDLAAAVQANFAGNEARYYLAGALILMGFGAKAGMYPLHVWLPMAHPVAPAPASALLSGIITKTGIFGVLVITSRIFMEAYWWGFAILILGVITMLLGGILALFSMNLKRTLACSSMSQLGMILTGIGMMVLLGEENTLAVRGVILHMFNHSNLKLVLFMAAGVVVMNLHKLDLNEIRGFGRNKPLLKYVFLLGSLGIGGIPLFNGYISKTLLHESIVEYWELLEEGLAAPIAGEGGVVFFVVVEWLFIITGAMTVAYMTKLFVVLFVEKNADAQVQASFDEKKRYVTPLSAAALGISATVLPVLGCLPYLTLDTVADLGQSFLVSHLEAHAVNYFSWTNIKGGLYSIGIGAVVYLVLVRGFMTEKCDGAVVYKNRWPEKLDLVKLIYEPLVMGIIPGILDAVCRFADRAADAVLNKNLVTRAAETILRFAEHILDGTCEWLKHTVYASATKARHHEPGYLAAFAAGNLLNGGVALLNRCVCREHPITTDYVAALTERERTLREAGSLIAAGISFSFLMFAIGLVLVVGYLLLIG